MVEVIEQQEILELESKGPGWLLQRGVTRRFPWQGVWNEMEVVGVVHTTAHPSQPKYMEWRHLWLSDSKAEVPMAQQLVSGGETLQEEGQ